MLEKDSQVVNQTDFDKLHSCSNLSCAMNSLEKHYLDEVSVNDGLSDPERLKNYEKWWKDFEPLVDCLYGRELESGAYSHMIKDVIQKGQLDPEYISQCINGVMKNPETL